MPRGRKAGVSLTASSAVEVVKRARGGICDMHVGLLDRVAEALRDAHPDVLSRDLVVALVNGRFARSRHPLLRNVTIADLRVRYRKMDRRVNAAATQRRVYRAT